MRNSVNPVASPTKHVRILFKSGESIVLEIVEFKVVISDGKVSGLDWVHSEDASFRLAFIDPAEIAAVCQIMNGVV
jgi:hypothetical protein